MVMPPNQGEWARCLMRLGSMHVEQSILDHDWARNLTMGTHVYKLQDSADPGIH